MKMREKNRRAALLFAGMLLLGGCGRMAEIPDPDRLQVVCTTYPQYSYLQAIIGEVSDSVELTLIMDDGTDLHSYQPVALDLVRIASADLLVYIGGESDTWVEDAAVEAVNPDMRMVSLVELAGERAKEEEIVEGMQERWSLTGHNHGHEHGDEDDHAHEDDHTHEDDHAHEDEAEKEIEYDEHVWLSLKNSIVFVDALAEQLEELDAAHAENYRANADAYIAQLEELDREYEEAVAGAGVRTLIFGDRFPFRYLTADYGLDYYAAFPVCSAETEASFTTVTFLAGKLDALDIHSILVLENSDQRVAETIRENTASKDQQILVLNSLQSVTKEELEAGATYLDGMRENLKVLKQALGSQDQG